MKVNNPVVKNSALLVDRSIWGGQDGGWVGWEVWGNVGDSP